MAEGKLSPNRLEAFSDGVIAVIITVMVLELKVPAVHEIAGNREALLATTPMVLVYLLSFVQVGIYWVNHHYMIDGVKRVTHGLLWSNLAFLFTLSLFPFATSWVHERGVTPFSIALYAVCSVLPGIAWSMESNFICAASGSTEGAGGQSKQMLSVLLYLGAIPAAYASPWLAIAMIMTVAVMWLVPPPSVREESLVARRGNSE